MRYRSKPNATDQIPLRGLHSLKIAFYSKKIHANKDVVLIMIKTDYDHHEGDYQPKKTKVIHNGVTKTS